MKPFVPLLLYSVLICLVVIPPVAHCISVTLHPNEVRLHNNAHSDVHISALEGRCKRVGVRLVNWYLVEHDQFRRDDDWEKYIECEADNTRNSTGYAAAFVFR